MSPLFTEATVTFSDDMEIQQQKGRFLSQARLSGPVRGGPFLQSPGDAGWRNFPALLRGCPRCCRLSGFGSLEGTPVVLCGQSSASRRAPRPSTLTSGHLLCSGLPVPSSSGAQAPSRTRNESLLVPLVSLEIFSKSRMYIKVFELGLIRLCESVTANLPSFQSSQAAVCP